MDRRRSAAEMQRVQRSLRERPVKPAEVLDAARSEPHQVLHGYRFTYTMLGCTCIDYHCPKHPEGEPVYGRDAPPDGSPRHCVTCGGAVFS